MESFGDELRRAREERGIPLRDMAVRTKISVGTLEALERNDFRRLPGGIFGRSFVRTYAIEAGLDPDTTVERFAEVLAAAEREAAERKRARQPAITLDDRQFIERQRRAYVLLRVGLVLAVLAAIAVVVWAVRTYWTAPRAPETTAAPLMTAPVAEAATAPPAAPAESGATGAATASPPADPAGGPMTALQIELDFAADAWMTISLDGRGQPSRLYRQGEHAELQAAEEVLIDAGNAGAVRLTINGRPARPLGAPGARIRTRITRANAGDFY